MWDRNLLDADTFDLRCKGDEAHSFKPASNNKRSEVADILCRMYLGIELHQFTLK